MYYYFFKKNQISKTDWRTYQEIKKKRTKEIYKEQEISIICVTNFAKTLKFRQMNRHIFQKKKCRDLFIKPFKLLRILQLNT